MCPQAYLLWARGATGAEVCFSLCGTRQGVGLMKQGIPKLENIAKTAQIFKIVEH